VDILTKKPLMRSGGQDISFAANVDSNTISKLDLTAIVKRTT
jgi:hypothetical protein